MGFMIEEALRYARAQGLLHHGMHVLVACSGGPDSLALLDILLRLRGRLRLALTVAHFEHGIRGASSEGDASFVAAFCKERGVPCFIGHGDVPSAARAQGKSLELAARELRYAFFWQTMARVGADVLATAHHADDQAETVLMRILRGTGLDGLSAMKPREGKKIRPLLFARRASLTAGRAALSRATMRRTISLIARATCCASRCCRTCSSHAIQKSRVRSASSLSSHAPIAITSSSSSMQSGPI